MHLMMILTLLCLFGRFGRGLAPRLGGLVGIGGVADVGGEELNSSALQTSETLAAEASHVTITRAGYDKLVYFSKICALTYCIKDRTLVENKTFYDGGCPADLEFCSNLTVNPTAKRTRVELVLEAERNELGTGYVAVDHGRQVVILAFRGSSTQQDWFSDMQIHPIAYVPASLTRYNKLVADGVIPPCVDCKVHRGFYRFAKTLNRNFLERIERIYNLYPNYKLVVTGHSLGAALASLCGIELALRGFEPLVLTYATPRMFNHSLRDWVNALFKTEQIHFESVQKKELQLNKGYFRVVHTRDYIPMVPPLYVAAGLEIYIEKLHFPHELKDLHYRGMNLEPLWHIEGDLLSPRSRFNERIEKWLHMYEHRSYFIMINTCSGF